MKAEDKELLIRDLCCRLPYGVIVEDRNCVHPLTTGNTEFTALFGGSGWHNIKPYLRPMSSMTPEEEKEFQEIKLSYHFDEDSYILLDWLNEHHFDYRGLIEKGLALEAPEGMYKD